MIEKPECIKVEQLASDFREGKHSIEIEYTPKPYGRKSCFHIPGRIMGSDAVPLVLPIQSYIYNDVNGGSVIVTDVSSNPYSSFEVVIQYVHKDLGNRSCISKITDAHDISSEEGFNIALKKLLHLAQKYMSEGERNNG